MATTTKTNISDIEDAANARWLSDKLLLARAEAKDLPTMEAVDRMRLAVFGETASRRKERSIAA